MRFPWQRGGDAAESRGPTHEEIQAAAEKWDSDTRSANLADRRRAGRRLVEGDGGRPSFWDRERTVSTGEGGQGVAETITARRILRRVLTAPDGYVVGFSGFAVKAVDGRRMCIGSDDLDRAFHDRFGRKLVARDPAALYCGTFTGGLALGAVAYAGPRSGEDAYQFMRKVAKAGGGRPDKGGGASFAQASGLDELRAEKVRTAALEVLTK